MCEFTFVCLPFVKAVKIGKQFFVKYHPHRGIAGVCFIRICWYLYIFDIMIENIYDISQYMQSK